MCSVSSVVLIPLKNNTGAEVEEEYITIDESDLPNASEVIKVLKTEGSSVDIWHRVALLYYRCGRLQDFVRILEIGRKLSFINSDCKSTSVVPLILSVAAYYAQTGHSTADKTASENFLVRATNWYNAAEKSGYPGYEVEYYVGRGYLHLYRSDVDQAKKHFDFILSSFDSQFVPALIGKAHIAFAEKDYASALLFFRRALQLNPNCIVNIRLGLGLCFWKLKQFEKAEIAFERAVEVFPNDVNAIAALGVYYLSKYDTASVRIGVHLLAKAYNISKTHSVALIYLADHFYFKKDLEQSTTLALEAKKYARSGDLQRRIAYLLGRCHQATGKLKHALHFYYEALFNEVDDDPFLLPFYGLGQCYLAFGNSDDRSRAVLNQLLIKEPNNYMAKRMVGCLDCNSRDVSLRENAQKYLHTVLEENPNDIISRTSLATAQECFDDVKALDNYKKVIAFCENKNRPISPEIYNNLACTCFGLKKYAEAKKWFEIAIDAFGLKVKAGLDPGTSLVTVNFNLARTQEALCDYRIAEAIYKNILNEHPSYYSCFIRLGLVAREKGNFYESSVYFKEALQFSQDHPDVWALAANLHLANQEIHLAKQKFQRILNLNPDTKRDSYAIVALGNVHLFELQQYVHGSVSGDKKKLEFLQAHHMTRATELYKMVLERDPMNIWAANGLGCIFALKGLFSEAREIFSGIREVVADFKGVWLNIAHLYMEQNMFFNAAQSYESCYRKFAKNTDSEILQHIAKAHYLNGSYEAAKMALLKCLRVVPKDKKVLFMLGRTLRKLGWQLLHSGTGNVDTAHAALQQLKQSFTIFTTLKRGSGEPVFLNAAADEARFCDDLIKQTPHLISRVEATFKEQQRLKLKREQEIKAYMDLQKKQKLRRDLLKRKEDAEVEKQREILKKKTEAVKQTLEAISMGKQKKEAEAIEPVVYYEESKPIVKKPKAKGRKRKPTAFLADSNIITKRRRRSKRLPTKKIVDSDEQCEDTSLILSNENDDEQNDLIQSNQEDTQVFELLSVSNEDNGTMPDILDNSQVDIVENDVADDMMGFDSPPPPELQSSVLDALFAEVGDEDENETQAVENEDVDIYEGIPVLIPIYDWGNQPEYEECDLPPVLHSVYSDSE